MKRSILICASLLVLLAPGGTARAAEDPARWDRSFDRAVKDHVRALTTLAKWCEKESLDASAWTMRQRALRWTPDDKDLKQDLGYRLNPGGEWVKDTNSREKLRKTWDTTPNPKTADRDKKLRRARTSAVKRFASLARKAAGEGGADWKAREERAWRSALRIDPEHEKAHVALGHPEVGGRRVFEKWAPFLRARQAFAAASGARARQSHETAPMGPHPILARAGLSAHGARCGQFVAQSQYGENVARQIALAMRRAAVELQIVYGFSNPLCGGAQYAFVGLQDAESWKKTLVGFGKSTKEATEDAEQGVYGSWVGAGLSAFAFYRENDGAGTQAVDGAVQSVANWSVMLQARGADPGAWFSEALSLDIVYRLTGQAIAVFVSDEGYRDQMRDSPEMNRWQMVSRLVVERDDDIPLRHLVNVRLNQMKTRHTSKAFCFFQFLRERGADDLKIFVREAMRMPPLEALEKVYDVSPEQMDREYAEWMRGTFVLTGS